MAVESREFDLLLMDLNYARDTTSGREGLDLLSHLKETEDAPAIVVMTGWATVGLAVEAMQYGVADFVEKPWSNARLLEILQKQIALGRERRDARRRTAQENQDHKEIALHFHLQEGKLPKRGPFSKGSCRRAFLSGGIRDRGRLAAGAQCRRRLLRRFGV